MYKQELQSTVQMSSSINTKTNCAETTKKVIHLGARFWLNLKDENA